jgi:hypothetical protein
VNLRDRLSNIHTNLDDLQSGVDASSREAARIQKTVITIERVHGTSAAIDELIAVLASAARELQACQHDQREALHGLRAAFVLLDRQMTAANSPVRPPPARASDRQSR